MLAFLPYPRHLFDADVDALFSPCPSPHGCRARPGAARGVLAPSGSMQLTREGDCYVVSAALPGVRPDYHGGLQGRQRPEQVVRR